MAIEFWESEDIRPLERLLKALTDPNNVGKEFLLLSVDEDEGLVEGSDACTWLQASKQQPGKIAWCMKDDDGVFELEFYEPTLEGIDSALSAHFDRQDELKWEDYEAFIKEFENP